jgi:AcrR family transcriptional regulator
MPSLTPSLAVFHGECTIWYMEWSSGSEGGQAEVSPPGSASEPARSTACRRLLDAVIEHFAEKGVADQSLRHIAQAVGTSHRMLLYHFGSKDGLLLAVVQEVESRTRERFAGIGAEAGGDSGELVRRMWAYVADPEVAGFERLFFALYARALQGDPATRPLLVDDIEGWLAANAPLAATAGIPPEVARAHARLGLAVTRGLLLDLLATGDRAGVEAAFEAFATNYSDRWWDASRREAQAPSGSTVSAS